MPTKIKVKKINLNAILPTKAHEGDAAFDLSCIEDFEIIENQTKLVKLGFSTEFPPGTCALIMPRSGLALKQNITIVNSPGLIDANYRGEWGVILYRLNANCNNGDLSTITRFKTGDRIAQVLFLNLDNNPEIEEVGIINDTTRGEGGFGSSGNQKFE